MYFLKTFRVIFPAVVLLLMVQDVIIAQEADRIAVVARSGESAITLRWAPTTASLWQQGRQDGYMIERAELDTTNEILPATVLMLTPAPIRPWTIDQWKARADRNNKYAAISAQMLYGKSYTPPSQNNEFSILQNASDEFTNRFGFALFAADNDRVAAEGQGLRFEDSTVEFGKRYVYRVFMGGNSRDNSLLKDTAYVMTRAVEPAPEQALIRVDAKGLDGVIRLTWHPITSKGYSGYVIHRSDDEGVTFKRLNANPLVGLRDSTGKGDIVYNDSTVRNYKKYLYAITGMTAFAEETIPVNVMTFARDLTPPPPPVVSSPQQDGASAMKITWTIPAGINDIAGFEVYRGANVSGEFTTLIGNPDETTPLNKLLPSKTRSYTDNSANEDESFYMVAVVDTAGNRSVSMPAMGLYMNPLPPPAPTGLRGTIDTNGAVQLTWNDVPLSRVAGFRVFRANDPLHEFGAISDTTIDDTTYSDNVNLQTLTRYVYYKVSSVEYNDRISKPSEMLMLQRPDIVAPVAPVLTDVVVSDSNVTLEWLPSASSDIAQQVIQRRSESSDWANLVTLPNSASSFKDITPLTSVQYQYRILAIDSSQHQSEPSLEVYARRYNAVLKASNISANYDKEKRAVNLHWQLPSVNIENRPGRIIIYRAVGSSDLKQLTSTEATETNFTDMRTSENGSYRYSVRFVAEGMQSDVSNEVTVVVE